MTRINFGIPVESLTDQHLLAEIRELPRIPNAVKQKIIKQFEVNGSPAALKKAQVQVLTGPFRLGTGHVTWFNDKLAYLHERYNNLYAECLKRHFKVKFYTDLFNLFEHGSVVQDRLLKYYNHVKPTVEDVRLVKSRIAQRVLESNQVPRRYGAALNKVDYVEKILENKS